uniref:Uncharacterized protein n=1 Tax=Arundo donax TaxID=35708 RepID=A0A0A8XS67_ARUDO
MVMQPRRSDMNSQKRIAGLMALNHKLKLVYVLMATCLSTTFLWQRHNKHMLSCHLTTKTLKGILNSSKSIVYAVRQLVLFVL